MSATKTLDPAVMAQFTGAIDYYRHCLNRKIVFTEGAKYVADHGGSCGAYWLLDEIALTQLSEKDVRAEEFQVWTLKVNADSTATLTCGDGNDRTVYTKELDYTDFQPEGITLWFANNTIYLPSEH